MSFTKEERAPEVPSENTPVRFLVEASAKRKWGDQGHWVGGGWPESGVALEVNCVGSGLVVRELPPMPTLAILCATFQSWMQSCSPFQLKDDSVKDGIRAVLRACGLEPNE